MSLDLPGDLVTKARTRVLPFATVVLTGVGAGLRFLAVECVGGWVVVLTDHCLSGPQP